MLPFPPLFILYVALWINFAFSAPTPGFMSWAKAKVLGKGKGAINPGASSSKSPPSVPYDATGLRPYTYFASAAYCPRYMVKAWSCGAPCKALPGFKITLAGGDGGKVPRFFVGFWPNEKAIVVGHQGTNTTKLKSDLYDLKFLPTALDPNRFPGANKRQRIHRGFQEAHARTAPQILAEVRRLMHPKNFNTNSVVVVGHSLGGAIAELDALYLTLNIPSAKVKAVTYGTPRVGNHDFVTWFDSKVPDFKRVNNKKDWVPIVPPRLKGLGLEHPHGEIHLLGPGKAVSCPGNDSEDPNCQVKSVPSVFKGTLQDHSGPYEGVSIGSKFCKEDTLKNRVKAYTKTSQKKLCRALSFLGRKMNKCV